MISIVIPVFNGEEYLSSCLESLLVQKDQSFELIMIDDGSTDNSYEICKKYESKFLKFKLIHQENKGLSAARNIGVKVSVGEYIAFIDADDWVHPTYIDELNKAINNHKSDVLMFGIQLSDGNNVIKPNAYQKHELSNLVMRNNEVLTCLFRFKMQSYSVCLLLRRELFTKIQFTDGIYYEDILFFHQLMRFDLKILCLDKILYYYRLSNGSSITKNPTIKKASDLLTIIKKLDDLYLVGDNVILYYPYRLNLICTALTIIYDAPKNIECEAILNELKQMFDYSLKHIPLNQLSKIPSFSKIVFMKLGILKMVLSIRNVRKKNL